MGGPRERAIVGDTGRTMGTMKGGELGKLLRDHGITQTEAARRLGVSSSTVSRWVIGDCGLPPHVVATIRAWRR
jgi:transcriptional regulator with XRE-family HTH domain